MPSTLVRRSKKKSLELRLKDLVSGAVKNIKPQAVPPLKDPTVPYNFSPVTSKRNAAFAPLEYNLAQIGRVEDTDSFVARSFNKKIALMFKEGWSLVGKNPKTIRYIQLRLAQIARASTKSTKELLRDLGSGLIRKSNVFIVKKRDIKASAGKVRQFPGSNKKIKPIAGYFTAPAETMEFSMVGNRIVQWRQRLPNGPTKSFNPDDVVHVYYDRKEGFVAGTPGLIPVIDDVRALRKIEENIELLIYQHLFPLFQWKVGTEQVPAGVTEDGYNEIDLVKREIQYMPSEGGIVTTERHEVKAIGSEGRALRAEGYLTHFKRRVFAGLGLSAIDFGESESANRSTAETLSQNLIDSVKDYQQVLEMFLNEFIINELLMESTFPFDVFDEENVVRLQFLEIDLELQIKKASHYTDQFLKNVIDLDEARTGMGKEPMPVPTFQEIDQGKDGPEHYPQWGKTNWVLFDRPKSIIQAVDEPYTDLSKARTAAEARQKRELQAKKVTKTKDVIEPNKITITDGFLVDRYKNTRSEILTYIVDSGKDTIDVNWIGKLIRASMTDTVERLQAEQTNAFSQGYSSFAPTGSDMFVRSMVKARGVLKDRVSKYITSLVDDVVETIKKNVERTKPFQESVSVLLAAFDSYEYRTRFIENVEIRKSYNYGRAVAMKNSGVNLLKIVNNGESCDSCLHKADEVIDMRYLTLSKVPPFHAHCDCGFKIAAEEIKDQLVENETHDKNIEDRVKKGTRKLNSCINRMKRSLESSNPELGQDELNHLARAICHMSDMSDGTADKNERCVLKVKKSLRKSHPDWSEDHVKTSAFKICNSRLRDIDG